jgi:hypothetical protein
MFGWGPATRIYLAAGATDMRKGFEGLYGLVREKLLLEPLSGHVFLFSNAQRNRLKLLFWEGPLPVAAGDQRAVQGGAEPRRIGHAPGRHRSVCREAPGLVPEGRCRGSGAHNSREKSSTIRHNAV